MDKDKEIALIEKFCKSQSPNYLEGLHESTKKFMIYASRAAFYTVDPRAKTDIAEIILNKLDNLDIEDFKYKDINVKKPKYDRKELKKMDIQNLQVLLDIEQITAKYKTKNGMINALIMRGTTRQAHKKDEYVGDLIQNYVSLMFLLRTHRHACTIIAGDLADQLYSISWQCFGGKRHLLRSFSFEEQFKACNEDPMVRFIIIPINLYDKDGCEGDIKDKSSHANFLIYDKRTKNIERFEPHGTRAYEYRTWFDIDQLDEELRKFLVEGKLDIIKYRPAIDFCPNFSFQTLQGMEGREFGGSCLVWSIWYADMRMSYPDIPPELLQKIMLKKLKEQPYSMTHFIKNYAEFLHNQTEEIRQATKYMKEDDMHAYMIEQMQEIQVERLLF